MRGVAFVWQMLPIKKGWWLKVHWRQNIQRRKDLSLNLFKANLIFFTPDEGCSFCVANVGHKERLVVKGSWNVRRTIDAVRPAPTWLLNMSGLRSTVNLSGFELLFFWNFSRLYLFLVNLCMIVSMIDSKKTSQTQLFNICLASTHLFLPHPSLV